MTRLPNSRSNPRPFLVFLKRFEHHFADLVLCRGVDDRPQQREAPPLAVDAVLTRGKGDVSSSPAAPFPDREADQLQSLERAFSEMQLSICELSGGVALVVWRNLDCPVTRSSMVSRPQRAGSYSERHSGASKPLP